MATRKLINIAIFGYENFGWTGGLNYIKNLLHSVSLIPGNNVKFHLFVSRAADPIAIEIFKPYANIITIPSKNIVQVFLKVIDKTFKTNYHLNYILNKFNIDVISHSYKKDVNNNVKRIIWIPDFQHIHMPEFFSKDENAIRNSSFKEKIIWADKVVLSSHDALKDFSNFSPDQKQKGIVLQFASSINNEIYNSTYEDFTKLISKYHLPKRFFYLPNQFWNHKNHQVVINSLIHLKSKGINDIVVVTTGNMDTNEVKYNVAQLNKAIKSNDLQSNIINLGLVSYTEVQILMRYAVSVINPSFFEGWSSSVEECKSLGKNMIVSNINVHKEQDPPDTLYFDPKNHIELSNCLLEKWNKYPGGPDIELELKTKSTLNSRMIEFGQNYLNIVNNLVTN